MAVSDYFIEGTYYLLLSNTNSYYLVTVPYVLVLFILGSDYCFNYMNIYLFILFGDKPVF